MPYAFVREFPGLTDEEFDRLRAEIGDDAPVGLIVHVAGPNEGGWRTIDVWETRADSERYGRDLLAPALARAGLRDRAHAAGLAVHHLLYGNVS